MLLFELFDDIDMIEYLRWQVLDYLTPLAAKDIKSVPIADIEQFLMDVKTGLVVDRGLIMRVLDPDLCKLVDSIDRDTIYLVKPIDKLNAKSEEREEQDKERLANKATDVAKKAVKAVK